MNARTLLLMCCLPLAGVAAADPLDAPRRGPDGWLYGSPPEGYEAVLRRVPHAAAPQPRQGAATIPAPRPRPSVLETSGATQADVPDDPPTPTPAPTSAPLPMPRPTPLAAEIPRGGSAIQIRAEGDAMSKVLDDISKLADLRYRTSVPLDATVSAAYSGPANTVITRLLSDNGYSFAISHSGAAIVLSIYGRWLGGMGSETSASNPIPAPAPPPVALQPPPVAEQQRIAAERQAQPPQHPSPPPEPRVPWGIAHRPH